ncbi:glutamic acid-rich protein [Orussus abietinus]|uniref:glutamic acid-rich protein n=1 Tax=Orussus abietinus TaxID=222816 RepID=UPI0006252DBE|nr:glutamic acid-rich protein [Orussus abietinus]
MRRRTAMTGVSSAMLVAAFIAGVISGSRGAYLGPADLQRGGPSANFFEVQGPSSGGLGLVARPDFAAQPDAGAQSDAVGGPSPDAAPLALPDPAPRFGYLTKSVKRSKVSVRKSKRYGRVRRARGGVKKKRIRRRKKKKPNGPDGKRRNGKRDKKRKKKKKDDKKDDKKNEEDEERNNQSRDLEDPDNDDEYEEVEEEEEEEEPLSPEEEEELRQFNQNVTDLEDSMMALKQAKISCTNQIEDQKTPTAALRKTKECLGLFRPELGLLYDMYKLVRDFV